MLIDKITSGYVAQTFDTETGKCSSQRFVVDEFQDWQDPISGDSLETKDVFENGKEPAFPFRMEQPK